VELSKTPNATYCQRTLVDRLTKTTKNLSQVTQPSVRDSTQDTQNEKLSFH